MPRRAINVGGELVELPEFPKKWILLGAVVLGILIFLFTTIFTVNTDEVGVVQRFGAYLRTAEPGLNFKLPFGIDRVTKVKIQNVYKEEFGFRTESAGVRTQFSSRDFSGESLMLTGDLNSALVSWVVQYKIEDPIKYLFKVRNVRETLRDISESVMRQVVGDRSVDEVIVLNRQEIEDEAHLLTQEVLNEFETGLKVVTVLLQVVNPPEPVQPAFNEVNEARQEKERIINEALEAYNKVIPQAKGEAEQTIRQGEGYATNRVNRAKGDANRFLAVWKEYSRAKDVTRRRLYLETMLEVFPNLDNIYVVDEQQKGLIPLLQLARKEVASK